MNQSDFKIQIYSNIYGKKKNQPSTKRKKKWNKVLISGFFTIDTSHLK